jgi:SAM-dependent methyltransferase
MRGWLPLYALSVRLGLRHLLRHGYSRQAVVRVVIPLDPSRYLELPVARRELEARPGQRVLDLASPKLLAVALAREGVQVTSVDELAPEVETWRRLAAGIPNVRFEVADGRSLPYGDATFDHAYSVSVLEHISDRGDEQALGELARVVRPGGRVFVTLPYGETYREDWRETPAYADHGADDGRYFFQRWYDPARLARLLESVPALELVRSETARLQPNWNVAYARLFPWLVPLGPLYGLLARERVDPRGDVVRLTLVKR